MLRNTSVQKILSGGAALFAALFLLSCTSTVKYEHQLDAWIGKSDGELIQAWGIPDKQYQLNPDTKLVSYVARDTISYSGNSLSTCFGAGGGNTLFDNCTSTFPPSTQTLQCETIFTLVKGRVTRWGHKGNDCRS